MGRCVTYWHGEEVGFQMTYLKQSITLWGFNSNAFLNLAENDEIADK